MKKKLLKQRVKQLEEAIKPFSWFAKNVDKHGWTSNIHLEAISTWFGPSDFRQAQEAHPVSDNQLSISNKPKWYEK